MTITDYFILAATFALGFVASTWSTARGLNICIKLVFVALAVVGAICSARVLGLSV